MGTVLAFRIFAGSQFMFSRQEIHHCNIGHIALKMSFPGSKVIGGGEPYCDDDDFFYGEWMGEKTFGV